MEQKETRTSFLIGERKSPLASELAVFEMFKDWPQLRTQKVIPEGSYFLVGILDRNPAQKCKENLKPGIFVQGYRPHSSTGAFACERRQYGSLLVGQQYWLYGDDVCLIEANLYQQKADDSFELVLANGEWRQREKVVAFMQRLAQENGVEPFSDVKKLSFVCTESSGYYLKGRSYQVWSMLVGKSTGMKLSKKALLVDFNSGVPGFIDYNAGDFTKG